MTATNVIFFRGLTTAGEYHDPKGLIDVAAAERLAKTSTELQRSIPSVIGPKPPVTSGPISRGLIVSAASPPAPRAS
jgi:hypothetical protein